MAPIRLSFFGGSAKGRRARSILLLAAIACLSCSDHELPPGNHPTAEKIRADALSRARQDAKNAMLIFVQPGSFWCEQLDKYHADPDVAKILTPHVVLAKIDVDETPGGAHMYYEHAPRNAPALVILDPNGMHLADSGEGDQNFGFPNNDDQVNQYIAMLQKGLPKLTDQDLATLREELDQLRTAN